MEREQAIKLVQDLLRRVVERKGSDLFITAGFPPAIKIDGELRPQSDRPLTAEQASVITRALMNDRQAKEYDSTKECNFAIAPPGIIEDDDEEPTQEQMQAKQQQQAAGSWQQAAGRGSRQ